MGNLRSLRVSDQQLFPCIPCSRLSSWTEGPGHPCKGSSSWKELVYRLCTDAVATRRAVQVAVHERFLLTRARLVPTESLGGEDTSWPRIPVRPVGRWPACNLSS